MGVTKGDTRNLDYSSQGYDSRFRGFGLVNILRRSSAKRKPLG